MSNKDFGSWNRSARHVARSLFQMEHFRNSPALPPHGYLDKCVWTGNDALFFSGWAVDANPDHDILRIEIYLNGKLIATPVRSLERPDVAVHFGQTAGPDAPSKFLVSGWSTTTAIGGPLWPYEDLLLVKAISSSGNEVLIKSCTLNKIIEFG